jgi:putative redox protein
VFPGADSAQESLIMTAAVASDTDAGQWVKARIGASGYRVDVHARTHWLLADEPLALRGTNAGPTPYELLLASLASCTVMTVRMYADRKGWPLEEAVVMLRQARSHEPDCEQCPTEDVGVTRIERRLELAGPLTDEQRARLLEIADRCPVKQTLERGITVV